MNNDHLYSSNSKCKLKTSNIKTTWEFETKMPGGYPTGFAILTNLVSN